MNLSTRKSGASATRAGSRVPKRAIRSVGFVGLGTMGTPMVLNLLNHGFRVRVFSAHMDSPNARLVVSRGAVAARSPRGVAEGSDVIMMCLPRVEVSESVVLGEDGVLAGAEPGAVLVEMSTVPPEAVKRFAAAAARRGVGVLDAPVSGGRTGADQGTLTIMVGGDKALFDSCLDVFKAMGSKVYHVGRLGAGETVKLVNAIMGNVNLLAAVEAMDLASRAGLDLKFIQPIIASSTGQSWAWNTLVPRMLESKNVGVALRVLLKDVSYALAMADEFGVDARISKEASAMILRLMEEKGGSADISSVVH